LGNREIINIFRKLGVISVRQSCRKRRLRHRTIDQLFKIKIKQRRKLIKNTRQERIKRWFINFYKEAI
jgi:hypothetical protein